MISQLKYYFKIILLENCPYSLNAKKLLDKYKIPCQQIIVSKKEKNKFKTELISTFPQIYIKKNMNNGNLLIGGYDDLKYYFDIFRSKPLTKELFSSIYSTNKFSKKGIIILYKLINI